ncbi:MAG: GNAT family N-acetyltransferase [Solirubrobacteraceae bacterium]
MAQIRDATPEDVELLFGLICELAEYERSPGKVTGSPELLADALSGAHPSAEAVIAELQGVPAGFALFHGTFSTWECRAGIWLEDLYVPPEHRRGGVGGELLRHVARTAMRRGCARLEWAALDWNTPALDFYAKLGAEVLDEWRMHRLDGATLARVAEQEPH